MADYIYLLENRLSKAQQTALEKVREVAGHKGFTVFLVGGAVRDLTSGSPVRDLDVAVQGNALKLKKDLEKAGARIAGESEPTQSLYLQFPGGVRMEIGSTMSVSYPKPGKPTFKAATIQEDLRRRDFTANAMALSLNQGSYGLLMDPLNGVADIENREIRLVTPYGFIEDPVRLIRAARFMARLGWQMDERTRTRYESAKEEDYIAAMPPGQRGYETEELFLEEDPLRVLKRLEADDWVKHLNPLVSSAKANVAELDRLREVQSQLHTRGIFAETSAASFSLLTAKMAPKDVAALKTSFARQAFAEEIDSLEAEGKAFAARLSGKEAAQPSQAWKLMHSARPEAVLWAAHHVKAGGVQNKLKSFYTEWPQARQKIPYAQMQEMRITPDVPGYDELLEKLFFELMDNRLGTVEEMKAYLEPYSPPAPPPPVNLRRARATRKDTKPAKARKKAAVANADVPLEGVAAEPADTPVTVVSAKERGGSQSKVSAKGIAASPAAKAAPSKKVAAVDKSEAPTHKAAVPTKSNAKKPAVVPAKKPLAKAAVSKKVVPVKSSVKVTPKKAVKAVAKKPVPKAPAKKTAVKKHVVAKKAAPAKKAASKPVGKKKTVAVKKRH